MHLLQGGSSLQHTSSSSSSRWREAAWLSVPTLFDLVATTLMNVGLLYVTASGEQAGRGADLCFRATGAGYLLQHPQLHVLDTGAHTDARTGTLT
jgi:hypothetical protein